MDDDRITLALDKEVSRVPTVVFLLVGIGIAGAAIAGATGAGPVERATVDESAELTVDVVDEDGDAPDGVTVVLYNESWGKLDERTVEQGNSVTFDSLTAGTYQFEVYRETSEDPRNEFWGSRKITFGSGEHRTVEFSRSAPLVESSQLRGSHPDAPLDASDTPRYYYEPGEQITVGVRVHNPAETALTVRVNFTACVDGDTQCGPDDDSRTVRLDPGEARDVRGSIGIPDTGIKEGPYLVDATVEADFGQGFAMTDLTEETQKFQVFDPLLDVRQENWAYNSSLADASLRGDRLTARGLNGTGVKIGMIVSGVDTSNPFYNRVDGSGWQTGLMNVEHTYNPDLGSGIEDDPGQAGGYHGTAVTSSVWQFAPNASYFVSKAVVNSLWGVIPTEDPRDRSQSLTHLLKHDPDVVIISSGVQADEELDSAFSNATDDITTVVAAAGNLGAGHLDPASPSTGQRVLSLAATGDGGEICTDSSPGNSTDIDGDGHPDKPDFAAPGCRVQTFGTFYDWDGSSFAAPFTAGVVAQLTQHADDHGKDASDVRRVLRETAIPTTTHNGSVDRDGDGSTVDDDLDGHGRVMPVGAYHELLADDTVPAVDVRVETTRVGADTATLRVTLDNTGNDTALRGGVHLQARGGASFQGNETGEFDWAQSDTTEGVEWLELYTDEGYVTSGNVTLSLVDEHDAVYNPHLKQYERYVARYPAEGRSPDGDRYAEGETPDRSIVNSPVNRHAGDDDFSVVDYPTPTRRLITSGWNQTYGGVFGDYADALARTADGGVAIAGSTFEVDNRDAWLVKVSPSGREEWNRTYGGSGSEKPFGLVQTADGGFALAGQTPSFGAGADDFWLVKVGSDGTEEWNRTYGTNGSETGRNFVQTADGGFALAGDKDSSGEFWLVKVGPDGTEEWNRTYSFDARGLNPVGVTQSTDGGFAILGPHSGDFRLIRTDAAGRVERNYTYGGVDTELPRSVVQTADGGFALAGYTWSYGVTPDESGKINPDFWLLKVGPDGTEEWNRTYGGSGSERAYDLVRTADDGFALAGKTDSFGAESGDFWLVRAGPVGTELWNRTYGGSATEEATALVQSANGDLVLAGWTRSFGAGSADIWLVKARKPTTRASVGPALANATATDADGDGNVTGGDTVTVSVDVTAGENGVDAVVASASALGVDEVTLRDPDGDGRYDATVTVDATPPQSPESHAIEITATDTVGNANRVRTNPLTFRAEIEGPAGDDAPLDLVVSPAVVASGNEVRVTVMDPESGRRVNATVSIGHRRLSMFATGLTGTTIDEPGTYTVTATRDDPSKGPTSATTNLTVVASESPGRAGETAVALRPASQTVTVGETAPLDVVVLNASGGVGRWNVTARIQDPDASSTDGVASPDELTAKVLELYDFPPHDVGSASTLNWGNAHLAPAVGGYARSVGGTFDHHFDGVDTTNSGRVDLVRFVIEGTTPRTVNVTLTVDELRDEGGNPYSVTATRNATIEVTERDGSDGDSPLAPPVTEYDTDGDGTITITELGSAAGDYATGDLSIAELGKIAAVYASEGT